MYNNESVLGHTCFLYAYTHVLSMSKRDVSVMRYNIITMEVLDIEGKEYVKSRDAAKKSGYTTDYIGQLCRGKEIDARLVGRSWYVDLEDLMDYRKEKKRSSRTKAREQVRKTIKQTQETKNNLKIEPTITYSNDEGDLIPNITKQWATATEVEKVEEVNAEVEKDEGTVENHPVAAQVMAEIEQRGAVSEDVESTNESSVSIPIQRGDSATKYAHKAQIAPVPQYDPHPPIDTYQKDAPQKEGHAYINIDTDDSKREKGGVPQLVQIMLISVVFILLALSLVIETRWTFTQNTEVLQTSYNLGIGSIRDIAKNIGISF